MPSPSFRSLLLTGFVLVAGLLAAVAIGAWLSLADFGSRSRESARRAIELSAAVQQLRERTIDMERNARQFLVLRDPQVHARFAESRRHALDALARLERSLPGATALASRWRRHADFGAAAQTTDDPAAFPGPEAVGDALRALAELNQGLTQHVARAIDDASTAQLDALDRQRERIAWQLVASIALTCLLLVLAGWWILRPLRRLARAIGALGEDRSSAPIAVGGPADLRALGRQLEWLRRRLGELEANRNRVLRHVSHELKTPLASLREGVALLADQVPGPLNDAQREVCAILAGSVRSLQERIELLLDYNASLFDASRLQPAPASLAAIAAEVLDEQRLPAQARDVRLELAGNAPPCRLDAGKMRIAISNLVANAIAFSPPGGTVRLLLGNTGGSCTLDCIDDGPGVTAEDAPSIFDPFVRGRQAANHGPGSGLGLAIVREFVRAHGGSVALLPSPQGAHFRIEVPHAC